MLHAICEGVEKVFVKAEPGVAGVSAIVTFASHYAATKAKKVILDGRWGCKLLHAAYY